MEVEGGPGDTGILRIPGFRFLKKSLAPVIMELEGGEVPFCNKKGARNLL